MPLKKSHVAANGSRGSGLQSSSQTDVSVLKETQNDRHTRSQQEHMKSRSRSASGSPDVVRLRAWRLDTLQDPPQVTFDELPEGKLNMDSGLLTENTSPERPTNNSRIPSSPLVGPTLRSGLMSPIEEPVGNGGWSSAVGHASTGKSGRVIERLQGDIDRLNRDKLVWKARFEEAEKTNETLGARNTYLIDRNSNLEQSQEADMRQLARKDRMIEQLRDELKRERLKTTAAEDNARTASELEQTWREEATKARATALQKEHEYESLAVIRNRDNERHQSALDRLRANFNKLLQDRKADREAHKRLDIIAEQQSQTIKRLEESTRKLTANNEAYRSEIDTTLSTLRSDAVQNDNDMTRAVKDLHEASDKMKWVMNIEKNFNKTQE